VCVRVLKSKVGLVVGINRSVSEALPSSVIKSSQNRVITKPPTERKLPEEHTHTHTLSLFFSHSYTGTLISAMTLFR